MNFSGCRILPWVLANNERHMFIKIYNLILLFVDSVTCLEQSKGEFAHKNELSGVEIASANWLQINFSMLYSLKISTRPTHNACFSLVTAYFNALLVPMQCFFFIGNGLHSRNACSPLLQVFLDLVIVLLILSTAKCQQHPPGSSQVKVIFYKGNSEEEIRN